MSANITLQSERRDGFTDNIDDPVGIPLAGPRSSDEYANKDADAGRIALALDVTDNFDARYAYDFSKKDQEPTASVLTAVDDPGLGFGALLSPYIQSEDDYPSKLSNDQSRYEKSEVEGHALHLSYRAGELGALGDVTFKSISSYRTLKWDDAINLDGSPINFFIPSRSTSKRMWVLRSWARRILTGDWTHAGYLNWDTGLAYRRWHLSRYWVFALGGLSTLAEAPVLDEQEQRWARWMFDRALGYYERLQAGPPAARGALDAPRRSARRRPTRSPTRSSSPRASPASSPTRRSPAPRTRPPSSRRRSSPTTRAAGAWRSRRRTTAPRSLDQTIRLGYGGVDLARLYDGRGRPLGSTGSHDRTGFGVAITRRNGRRLLETQGGHRAAHALPVRQAAARRLHDAHDDGDRPGPAAHVRQGPPDVPRRPDRHDVRPARAADVDRPHPLPRLGPPDPRAPPAS